MHPNRALRQRSTLGAARHRGFTLLEVMGAVALLGLVYLILVNWDIQGLRAEGDAVRRLEAITLADAQMGELELAMLQNTLELVPGLDTQDKDPFSVETEIEPFEFTLPEPIPPPQTNPADKTPTTLELYRIDVRVTWNESDGERRITRTTFAAPSEPLQTTGQPLTPGQPQNSGRRQTSEQSETSGQPQTPGQSRTPGRRPGNRFPDRHLQPPFTPEGGR